MPDRRRATRAAAFSLFSAPLLFASLLFALPAAAIDPSGESLLRQAVVADDRASYTGTITTVVYGPSRADATVVRIDHSAPNKWRMWYVAPADAYGRLIISNESLTYQYEPKINTVYSDAWGASSPGVILALNASKVLKNYSVEVGPSTDIAGRESTSLSLVSKHSGALAERLWLDAATNLVLRRETYHGDGTIDTKTSFDNIRVVNDLPKQLFDLTVPAGMHVVPGTTYGKTGKDLASIQSSVNFSFVSPTYLPDGFTLETSSLVTRGGVQNVQLLYTDGLRDFSLFENSTSTLPKIVNAKRIDIGDESGVTTELIGETLVSWNAGRLNITMVGDLTPRELAKIGASIRP